MRRLPAFHPPVLLISSFLFLPDTFMFLHTNLEDWLFLTSTSWSVILYTRGELFDAFSLSARLLHFVQSSLYAKSYLMHSLCPRGFSILFRHLCMQRAIWCILSVHAASPFCSVIFVCMYRAIWCILSVHAASPFCSVIFVCTELFDAFSLSTRLFPRTTDCLPPTPLRSISLDPTLINARFTRVDGLQGVKNQFSLYHLGS